MTKTPLSEVEVWDAGSLSGYPYYYITNIEAKRAVSVLITKESVTIDTMDWRELPSDYNVLGPSYMGPMHSDILNIARRMI